MNATIKQYTAQFRGEFLAMTKDPLWQMYNHEPVTAAREAAYIARRFQELRCWNRHNERFMLEIEGA